MLINYTNKLEDYTQLSVSYMKFSCRGKRWSIFALATFVFILSFSVGITTRSFYSMFLAAIIAAGLSPFVLRTGFLLLARHIRRNHRWGANIKPVGHHDITISEDGIYDLTNGREEKLRWENLVCYIITEDYVFIYIDQQNGFPIPRSSLSDVQMVELRGLLSGHLKCEHEER